MEKSIDGGIGLAGLDAVTIARKLAADPERAKRIAVRADGVRRNVGRGSRQDANNLEYQLTQPLQADLDKGLARYVDANYYFVKYAGGTKYLEMIDPNSAIEVGVSNLQDAKLPLGRPFMLSAIMLLQAVGTGTGKADAFGLDFGRLTPACLNGEIELGTNKTSIMPLQSIQVPFGTHRVEEKLVDVDGSATGPNAATAVVMGEPGKVGLYKLDSPAWIASDEKFFCKLYWPEVLPVNTFLKIILIGQSIYRPK